LLVRYGEISLKGKNRKKFEDLLIRNIKQALRNIPHGEISRTYGRIYLETKGNWGEIAHKLERVFGIVSISPVVQTELEIGAIKEAALRELHAASPKTFKVETKRPYKRFPMNTPEINEEVGGFLLSSHPDVQVDVHNPEARVTIEVRQEGAFVYCQRIPALGGLPVGCSGKGILLLSGGIDSPVAGFLSMKRGINVEGLHFYSYPFTNERSKEKVIELARILSEYNYNRVFRLWICHFTEIQKALQSNPYPELKITLMRRFMLQIAVKLAERERALALITGDSLGQVASQTMGSIHTINAVTTLPIFRPLIGFDKQEIIDISRKIDTYETSILPHEDCCTVFVPKNPATRPTVEQAVIAEESLDVKGLIEEALKRTTLHEISSRTSIF